MTNPTPAESPCQEGTPPFQEGTLLCCPDCGCRWRFHPRSLSASLEELEAFGAAVGEEERTKMERACHVPYCPGCFRLSGAPATDQPPLDLDLGGVRSILEAAGFEKEDSEPAAFVVDANFPIRELWLFEGAAGTVTDTPIAPGAGIDVSPDKLPETPRIAQAPRLVSVTLRALCMDEVEPRSPVGWIKVLSGGRAWPVDRASLDSDLKQALLWAAEQ